MRRAELLAKNDEMYQAVFHQAAVGIARVALDGTWIEVNQRLCDIVGYSEEELLGRTFQNITHPDDLDTDLELARQVLARERDTYSMEKRYFRKSGDIVWVCLTVSLVCDERDEPKYFIAIIEDISKRKQAELSHRESEERLSLLIKHAPAALAMFDRNMRYMVVSRRWIDDYRLDEKEILGRSHYDIFPDLPAAWKEVHRRGLAGEVISAEEERFERPDGSVQWLHWVVRPWHTSDNNVGGIVIFAEDITDRKLAHERLKHMAHHDPLTGLPNRRLLNQRLNQSIRHAARHRVHLAVIFVDIDHFKHINDGLGHATGDQVLKEVGRRLRQEVRNEDSVARISGDEFVVLLEAISNSEHIIPIVEKLMHCFDRPVSTGDREIRVTASMGICMYPEDGDDAPTLLRNADAAMYSAKSEGRGSHQFYSREMTALAFERLFFESAMQEALDQNEFQLVYQPQVELLTGRFIGVEALLRWRHPKRGIIPPSKFIPLAEQNGLIRKINAWVLASACAQGKAWREQGFEFGRIAVNVSGHQIGEDDCVNMVRGVLENAGLTAEQLELEVTEGSVMRSTGSSVKQLQALRDIGVQIAIDDFGTGYSSLSYLKQLPIDKLKIDRSFIRDIPEVSNDNAITEAIIAMGRALSMKVVAEGVETEAQAMFLRHKGCEFAQGFLFAQPMSPEKVMTLFQKHLVKDEPALCGLAPMI